MSGIESKPNTRVEHFVEWLKRTTFFSVLLPPNSRRKHFAWLVYKIMFPQRSIPVPPDSQSVVSSSCKLKDSDVHNVEIFLTVSRHAGFPIASGAKILDFGCGAGAMVRTLVDLGYDAHGYDIVDYRDEKSRTLEGRFAFLDGGPRETGNHVIDWNGFSLPYLDNSFDVVFTSQVFEHVMQHEPVFSEFARVMKPGAASINLFPPRNHPMEQHIRVPLGHRIHSKAYYYIMAKLGCRNEYQHGLDPSTIAENDYRYVRDGLNYVSNRKLIRIAARYFNYVRIDQNALFNGAKFSRLRHWYLENFYSNMCFVMADKKS
jgi:SAM-dependent methyltransferase